MTAFLLGQVVHQSSPPSNGATRLHLRQRPAVGGRRLGSLALCRASSDCKSAHDLSRAPCKTWISKPLPWSWVIAPIGDRRPGQLETGQMVQLCVLGRLCRRKRRASPKSDDRAATGGRSTRPTLGELYSIFVQPILRTQNYPVVPGGVMRVWPGRDASLAQFRVAFSDEARCVQYLFEQRWPDGFVCPACGGKHAVLLRSRAYTYECRGCGRQTSITAGTAMHRSKLPLTRWFLAAHFIAADPACVSVSKLRAELGITYKTSWLLKQKFQRLTDSQPLDGTVEIGLTKIPLQGVDAVSSRGKSRPTLIVAAIGVGTLQVRLAAIPDNSATSIEPFIRANVRPGTSLPIRPPCRLQITEPRRSRLIPWRTP